MAQLHNGDYRVVLLVLMTRSPHLLRCSCQQESDRRATTFAIASSIGLHDSFNTTTGVASFVVIVPSSIRCIPIRVIREIVAAALLPACRSRIERRRSGPTISRHGWHPYRNRSQVAFVEIQKLIDLLFFQLMLFLNDDYVQYGTHL